ncbi:hypothetical protein E2493_19395, partial [Sphingomonas parva]
WNDAVEFDATIAPADIVVEKSSDGNHLILKIAGSEDRITMEWAVTDANYRIDQVRFADGTIWTHADVLARAVAPIPAGSTFTGTGAGETITGTSRSDRLLGGGGDDILIGDSGGYYENLLVNGGFEQSGPSPSRASWGYSNPTLPGWTKTNASAFEQVDSGHQSVIATEGRYWLDLDGSGTDGNMVISQQVTGLVAGESLVLRFDHANRMNAASGSFEVLWNDQLVASYTTTGVAMIGEVINLVARDGMNQLTFRGTGTVDGGGASLDNVQLYRPILIPGTTSGKDVLDGGAGNDTLLGGANDDQLIGGTENDLLDGGTGDDNLSGDAGSDTLIGGQGNDTLAGGAGDDVYRWNLGDGQDTVNDAGGIDAIVFGPGITAADLVIRQQGSTGLVVRIRDTDERLTLLNAFGTAANRIEEFRFDDGSVLGEAQILALSMASTDGNDVLYGTGAADVMSGGLGDDTINALGGDDQLFGNAGADTLTGDTGNDLLVGGTGRDALIGGAGNDVYSFARGDGDDTITDTAGIDRIDFGEGILPGEIEVRQVGSTGLMLAIAGSSDRLTIVNAQSVAGNAIEEVKFADGTVWTHAQLIAKAMVSTDGNDVLYGTGAADVMHGGLGDDSLNSLGGNDQLFGDEGNDSLTGDVGDDVLDGGRGGDSLAGGGGNDVYRFAIGDGQDTITDT